MIGVAGGCASLQDGTPPATPSRRSNVNMTTLPSGAPEILIKNTIHVKANHAILALHEVEQRRKFQSLVRRYIGQILDGCQEPYCTTPSCLSFRRRVTDVPLRKFTALSARTVACFLASEDEPEKALCPHKPAKPPSVQALTESGTNQSHGKHEARLVARPAARPDKDTSEAGTVVSTVKPERVAKGGAVTAGVGESLVSNKSRSDGVHSHDSRNGDKTKEASVEKGREKDPKSFTQNLFDTFAVRMLEWLPVPTLMSVPDSTLGGEENHDCSETPKMNGNQAIMKESEHSNKVESQKLGSQEGGGSKLKPRSHSVTTRLRLNSASTPNHTNSPASRKSLKPRALGANEEVKQEGQPYQRPEMLRQRQGLREQGVQATTQSEIPGEVERMTDGSDFHAGIWNEGCNTASGSPDTAKTWGQLKAWITQNQEDTSVGYKEILGSPEDSQKLNGVGGHLVDTMESPSRSPTFEISDPDPTLEFDIPVEQSLASNNASVQTDPRDSYAHHGPTRPISSTDKLPPIDILGGPHGNDLSISRRPPDTALKYGADFKRPFPAVPDRDHTSSAQTMLPVKRSTSSSTGRPPQTLSHLSVDIVEGLLDIVKPTSNIAEDPLLFYRLSGFRVGQASKASILRQHRRALQFGAQSLFYVMSTPEALLRSFRKRPNDDSEPSTENKLIKSDHPSEIDQAIRCLKVFDESRVVFRSLWIALGALFTPPPDLSHPKSPRLKAAISLSKTRSSSSSGEHAAVPSSTNTVYYSDREAVHILKLTLSALVAVVPQASAQTMLAVRTLRASGRVAPEENLLATNAELVGSLLEITDALEDELALSLMCRLVRAIAARSCAAEIIKNKQTRNYSCTSQESAPLDVLDLLREYLKEAHSETPYSGAAKSLTASRSEPKTTAVSSIGWSMSAVTVEWLRSVLLKEWDDGQHEELGLSPEVFHTPFLAERLDPMEMPVEWLANGPSNKSLHLLSYSFLFPPSALVTYFRALNFASMSKAYEAAMTTSRLVLHLAFAGDQNESRLCTRLKTAMSTNLVIEVRRDNVLRDALNQLWRRERRELMRPLKVRMGMDEGEEGVDHGGVQQEFFRMAIGEALNPDYGLFTTDSRTFMSWFQPCSLEPPYKFELLGMLTSLAVYNGLTLPITFPKALYRKLLGLAVTDLEHIRDGWPDLARGLSDLLTWTAGDVEDVFMRSYEFVIDGPGSTLSVDMKRIGRKDRWPTIGNTMGESKSKNAAIKQDQPSDNVRKKDESNSAHSSKSNNENTTMEGQHQVQDQLYTGQYRTLEPQQSSTDFNNFEASLVNNSNREQYVKDYIFWLTDKSIRPQYEAFARGFYTCLDRKALSMFTPEALQSVVEGIQEIDIDGLERTARYDDGYSASHRTVRDFWHVVRQYSPEKKRQLLEFVTASDRVPVNGINTILFVIQRNGTDDDRVPTSLTCFGRLLLPEYSSRKKLKEKLKIAIENSRVAPIVHCVRHAQGYHNLSPANYVMHDPDLTPLGEEQCRQLTASFPYHKTIELLVASPLRRTISTALLAFDQEVQRGMRVIALPIAQETSALPSDTGSDADVLRKEMADKPVDLSLVHEGWNSKEGKWAAEAGALERRAQEARRWLKARPEKEVVLVTHGGFLHYLSEDWSDSGRFNGTGWANAEFRTYRFVDPSDENASLEETGESRERRRGTEKPLSETEQMELRQTTHKSWEQDGFQVQSKA